MPSLSTYISQACILSENSILLTRRMNKTILYSLFNFFEITDRSFILEVYFTGKKTS